MYIARLQETVDCFYGTDTGDSISCIKFFSTNDSVSCIDLLEDFGVWDNEEIDSQRLRNKVAEKRLFKTTRWLHHFFGKTLSKSEGLPVVHRPIRALFSKSGYVSSIGKRRKGVI